MREYLDLGATPCDESCAQVGTEGYLEKAQAECRAYVNQLRRMFGEKPDTKIYVKSHSHDFGTYLSVVVRYYSDVPDSVEYAFHVENNLPGEWDEQARAELGL